MWQSRTVATAFVFLFGLLIGSFLNVCIARLPEEQSIVAPRSRCPRCGAPIRPYDNIPVLSWLLLRGRCRDCRVRISLWYPVVELLTAFLFVRCYQAFGISLFGLKWLFFACLLVVLTVTDLRKRLLPDAVTWPGFGLGLAFSAAAPPQDGIALGLISRFLHRLPPAAVLGVADALIGALFGSLMLWLAGWVYLRWRGREGMGFGDVKMMAMVGAFLGLRDTFLTILAGTLLGTAVGIGIIVVLYASGWKHEVAQRASQRGLGRLNSLRWALASRYQLPLGSFLGIAALLIALFGDAAWGWWFAWAGR
jgi:leader peptidase (prepilin peptidase) / N-methyltransferase